MLPILFALVMLTAPEQALFDMTNADRALYGLPPLVLDATLEEVARARAGQLINRISHYDQDGQEIYVPMLMAEPGFHWSLGGENLARVPGEYGPAWIDAEWLASPGHRKNLLEPRFVRVGIGSWQSSRMFTVAAVFSD